MLFDARESVRACVCVYACARVHSKIQNLKETDENGTKYIFSSFKKLQAGHI